MHAYDPADAPAPACRQQGRLTVTTVTTSRQARAAAALVAESLGDPCATLPPPPAGTLLIARDGSSSVGVVHVRRRDDSTAALTLLYVRPWSRRRGVGTALLRGAVVAARRLGARRLVVEPAQIRPNRA